MSVQPAGQGNSVNIGQWFETGTWHRYELAGADLPDLSRKRLEYAVVDGDLNVSVKVAGYLGVSVRVTPATNRNAKTRESFSPLFLVA